MKNIFGVVLISLFTSLSYGQTESNAAWMSGEYGLWFQLYGGSSLDNAIANGYDYVAGAQEIVDHLPGAGYILTSLSHSAHGYYFTLNGNTKMDVSSIHPDFVPSEINEQVILDVINVFKDAGKKVLLYIATDGPGARAGTPDNIEYTTAWNAFVDTTYNGDEALAYRDLCEGFMERLAPIVDGYWLDHIGGMAGDPEEYVAMIRRVDSTAAIALNSGGEYFTYEDGSYMMAPGVPGFRTERDFQIKKHVAASISSDYTGGHPIPLGMGAPPNHWSVEEFTHRDMIEAPWDTLEGKKILKHAFIPMQDYWTPPSGTLMFTDVEQAYRIVRRLTDAGAAITWSTSNQFGKMSTDEMEILEEVDRRLQMAPKMDYIPYSRPAGEVLVGEELADNYQSITFPMLEKKKIGDASFPLNAITSSGLPISYVSSNTDVAVILEGDIHILSAGTSLITASQSGNNEYAAASDAIRRLTVIEEDTLTVNLALTGTATQSSTNYDGKASRAIDGNSNGSFSQGSVSHTNAEDNAWWQVDLGGDHNLESITIFNRTDDCCKLRLANFTIYVLNSAGDTTYSEIITNSPDPSVTVDVSGIQGQIVKVQLNGRSVLNLAEVQVFAVPHTASFIVVDEVTKARIPYATLAINNRHYTSNNKGEIQVSLLQNHYPFSLNKIGYFDLNDSISILKDTSLILELNAKEQYDLSFQMQDSTTKQKLSGVELMLEDISYLSDSVGLVNLTLYEGEYDYEVMKLAYHSQSQHLELSKDTLIVLELGKASFTTNFQVNNTDNKKSLPEVFITINDTTYKTDTLGASSMELNYGEYEYTLNKIGYSPIIGSLKLTKDTLLILKIDKANFTLDISVKAAGSDKEISNVIVAINDRLYKTDAQGTLSIMLDYGDYYYTVSKEGYEEKVGAVFVSKDSTLELYLSIIAEIEQTINYTTKIYPNPVTDKVTISLSTPDNAHLSIINSRGELVYCTHLQKSPSTIDMRYLPTGIYILKMVTKNKTYYKKIIK